MKVKYTNEPMGRTKIINDFLPKPEDLILKKEENVKITLLLSKEKTCTLSGHDPQFIK